MLQSNFVKKMKMNASGALLSSILSGVVATMDLKIAHYDSSTDPAHPDFREPCIWVFWHEYIWLPVAMWKMCDVTMLVSQHRDGQYLTNAAEKMGFGMVRGSTNRGGADALRQIKKMTGTSGYGISPDGPRGPRREMALGPIYLASRLGIPVVPTGFGYQTPKRLNTWDKFAIPKPFTRARAIMGNKIIVPPKLKRDGLENYRQMVQNQISQVTETAENWAHNGYRLENEMKFKRRPNRNWLDSKSPEKNHQKGATLSASSRRAA